MLFTEHFRCACTMHSHFCYFRFRSCPCRTRALLCWHFIHVAPPITISRKSGREGVIEWDRENEKWYACKIWERFCAWIYIILTTLPFSNIISFTWSENQNETHCTTIPYFLHSFKIIYIIFFFPRCVCMCLGAVCRCGMWIETSSAAVS